MPRKGFVRKREVIPDTKFGEALLTRFINNMMRDGKKSVSEKIVYGAIDIIGKKSNANGLTVFKQAIDNVKPMLEVKPRRVGGATYQIPIEVPPARKTSLAVRWIIDAAKARTEKTMLEKLAGEILDASKNAGAAIKKRDDTHKMAEANKAFVHFRW